MKQLIPHLWFDNQAKEAAEFYTSLFPKSKINSINTIHDTPSGDCDIVSFEIQGQSFMAISAGPVFKINPSISFMVNFDPSRDSNPKEQIDKIWAELSKDGKVLMPLQEYPFSKWYGWIQDKFGVSWQLIMTNPAGEPRPEIVPSLLFTQGHAGKAEEAMNFYLAVFKESTKGTIMRYPAGMEPDKEGTVMFEDFKLLGTWLAAMDSAQKHEFEFNEAISFIVNCDTQEEIDYYWGKLSAVPESEQCGWLKDKYGVSWQIVPTAMEELMKTDDETKRDKVTQAFLKMKKFDIAALKKAAE